MSASITAGEIKEIRGKYGLSQKAFATLLGIGPASIVRYEKGGVPSKANANLIRAAAHPDFMLECLQRDGDQLTARQRESVSRVCYAFVELPEAPEAEPAATRKETPRMTAAHPDPAQRVNETYDLTLRQEVLNEQAANLIAEIISIKITRGFSGHASEVFDTLLDQLSAVKPSIVSFETMDHSKLDSIAGYLNCADELLSRRLLNEVA